MSGPEWMYKGKIYGSPNEIIEELSSLLETAQQEIDRLNGHRALKCGHGVTFSSSIPCIPCEIFRLHDELRDANLQVGDLNEMRTKAIHFVKVWEGSKEAFATSSTFQALIKALTAYEHKDTVNRLDASRKLCDEPHPRGHGKCWLPPLHDEFHENAFSHWPLAPIEGGTEKKDCKHENMARRSWMNGLLICGLCGHEVPAVVEKRLDAPAPPLPYSGAGTTEDRSEATHYKCVRCWIDVPGGKFCPKCGQ